MAASATRERRPDREPRAEAERAPPTSTRRRSPDLAAVSSGHDVGRCPVRPAVRPLRATGVSTPGDAAETHAEAVAHRVRHGAVPDVSHVAGSPARLPRAASADAGTFSVGLPPVVDRVLTSPTGGTPIPAAVRSRVEPHVGVDLGGVRVLTGPRASTAAASIGARAFTAGSTIVLGRGQSPHDTALMAHEATHVAQHALGPARFDVHRATILRDLLPSLPDLPDISVTDLLPQSLLDAVTSAVRSIPGYTLLTQVIGTDPLTGAPVEADPQAMLDELLSYGPFGAAVGQALQAMDALDAVVTLVRESLGRYGLTSARLSADIDTAWAQFSIANRIDGNLAIVERVVGGILADVGRFVTDLAERILAIVREAAVDLAESLLTGDGALGPVWSLATKVFHFDPLRGVPVEAATVDILADFLHLIGQDAALDQMRERGTLQETADWLDTQFATFLGLLDQATTLFGDAWAAIQPENLAQLPETLLGLIQQEFALVVGVGTFAGTVLLKVIELVKHSLTSWLSEYAYAIPGFRLVSVIIGQNPFTGEEVPLTAENLIGGFITLLPGGEATYQQLAETGVIGEAAARIESAMATLGITPELITTTFLGLWNTLSLDDLLAPLDAFQQVVALFGEPIARIVEFVSVVVQVVIELILRLMNFPSDLLAHILSQTVQAITDIQADPVGFLMRMVEALKAGFQGFLDNSLDYLMQGLVAWLFRGLAQLGITIPTEISFGSILGLVLEVLGLTTDFMWRKLEEHTSKDQVEAIRKGMATLGGAWAFLQDVSDRGIVAIWEYVVDRLSTLWSTILSMAAEWALKTIIVNGTIKLLTFLDPTFIMSVVNGCIAFFEAVRSAIEYITDILQIVDMYVSTFASIAKGDIGPGAQMIEQGLAAAVPVALGFLAAQLGLGNIPDKIAEIIGSIREVVEAAIDWLIEQALRLGRAALDALGLGQQQPQSTDDRPVLETFELNGQHHQIYADTSGALMIASDGAHPVSGISQLQALYSEYQAPRSTTLRQRLDVLDRMADMIKTDPALIALFGGQPVDPAALSVAVGDSVLIRRNSTKGDILGVYVIAVHQVVVGVGDPVPATPSKPKQPRTAEIGIKVLHPEQGKLDLPYTKYGPIATPSKLWEREPGGKPALVGFGSVGSGGKARIGNPLKVGKDADIPKHLWASVGYGSKLGIWIEAGHLLGKQFGGPGAYSTGNIVPMTKAANTTRPGMQGIEYPTRQAINADPSGVFDYAASVTYGPGQIPPTRIFVTVTKIWPLGAGLPPTFPKIPYEIDNTK